MRIPKLSWLLLAALCPLALRAQEEPPKVLRYSPASHGFACDLPSAQWQAFEEEEPFGTATHILGPDDPAGNFRAGIDIRLIEKGRPGFIPYANVLDRMRRSEQQTERSASGVAHLRVAGVTARIFEVTETRRLPPDALPAAKAELHHYYAVLPSGESYWVLRLSSSREVYLDYRNVFLKFLKSFKPLGV